MWHQAELIFDQVQLMYPEATVVASQAFDDFIADVEPVQACHTPKIAQYSAP